MRADLHSRVIHSPVNSDGSPKSPSKSNKNINTVTKTRKGAIVRMYGCTDPSDPRPVTVISRCNGHPVPPVEPHSEDITPPEEMISEDPHFISSIPKSPKCNGRP